MAKKKFYAVQVGIVPGVYDNWDDCKLQIDGYSGAKYKAFSSQEEAMAFVDNKDVDLLADDKHVLKSVDLPDGPYAFVDGSFNSETGVYGYGGFLCVNGEKYFLMGSDNKSDMTSMRNVAGEISGAMAAVDKAESLGIRELTMFYDYKGIEQWATGGWKTNKAATREYAEFMNPDNRAVSVQFKHVKGHTGIDGNELADVIAKTAVGISLTQKQQKLYDSMLSNMGTNDIELLKGVGNMELKSNVSSVHVMPEKDAYIEYIMQNEDNSNKVAKLNELLADTPYVVFPEDVSPCGAHKICSERLERGDNIYGYTVSDYEIDNMLSDLQSLRDENLLQSSRDVIPVLCKYSSCLVDIEHDSYVSDYQAYDVRVYDIDDDIADSSEYAGNSGLDYMQFQNCLSESVRAAVAHYDEKHGMKQYPVIMDIGTKDDTYPVWQSNESIHDGAYSYLKDETCVKRNNEKFKAVGEMYKYLQHSGILKDVAERYEEFVTEDGTQAYSFVVYTGNLEPYRDAMMQSGVANSKLACKAIFNDDYQQDMCSCTGATVPSWTNYSYRNQQVSYENPVVQSLNDADVQKLSQVRKSNGIIAATAMAFDMQSIKGFGFSHQSQSFKDDALVKNSSHRRLPENGEELLQQLQQTDMQLGD